MGQDQSKDTTIPHPVNIRKANTQGRQDTVKSGAQNLDLIEI